MAQSTKIEWCDEVWNPVTGCTPVSAGCQHCFAKAFAKRFWKGRPFSDVQCHEDQLDQPMKRRKPTTYFVNSMSDLFHPAVPFYFVDRVFATMALCRQHTFMVLTKRPERMTRYSESLAGSACSHRDAVNERYGFDAGLQFEQALCGASEYPLPNVAYGTSVENQPTADARIPHLLRCPAALRFVSAEPLLGAVSLERWLGYYVCQWCLDERAPHHFDGFDILICNECGAEMGADGCPKHGDSDCRPRCPMCGQDDTFPWEGYDPDESHPQIHSIIMGGESGPGARPCNVEHIRSLVEQCKAAGVKCFLKQLGAKPVHNGKPTGEFRTGPNGKRQLEMTYDVLKLKHPKGGDPAEWPEDLRVRELPSMTAGKGGA